MAKSRAVSSCLFHTCHSEPHTFSVSLLSPPFLQTQAQTPCYQLLGICHVALLMGVDKGARESQGMSLWQLPTFFQPFKTEWLWQSPEKWLVRGVLRFTAHQKPLLHRGWMKPRPEASTTELSWEVLIVDRKLWSGAWVWKQPQSSVLVFIFLNFYQV